MKVDSEALALARAKWQSSGLTDEHAKRLRFHPLGPGETAELGKFHAVRSMRIPYFDPLGKTTDFYRIRYLEKLPGAAGVVEKPQRYAQPAGTLNEVYMPPLLDTTWKAVGEDTSTTIYITEGELKAACACAHGFATLGLGGVDTWLSSKRGIPILPTLKQQIKWQNRDVVIIYDSDAATNLNVVRAQRRLAHELVTMGAKPRIAALPSKPDGSKQGLDDLIVAVGPDALQDAISAAPEFPEAEALWGMNEEVIYVKKPGFVVVRETGQKIDPGSFMSHAYANRHYAAIKITKDGQRFEKKRLAPRWIEWEHRAEVAAMTYAPGADKIVDGKWNTWPGWGVDPKKGDLDPWKRLLDRIFKGFPDSREWFERWAAYPLQHPGAKMYAAPLIWSTAHGTGKTLLFYCIMKIYGSNAIEIKNRHLKGGFNAWQANKQFIYGDEIEGGGDVGSKKIDSEWLKGLITQQDVTINEKFLPEYTIPDVMNYGFSSNKPDAVFLDDKDRRFMIHEVVGNPESRDFYDKIDKWMKGDGPAALFYHLLNLNLGNFHPLEHAPMTLAKQVMIMNAKSDVGIWCVGLREDPTTILAPFGEEVAKGCDLFNANQLHFIFGAEASRTSIAFLGRELQKAGLRQVNGGTPVRTAKGIIRLYAVRNVEKWCHATPKEISDHYNLFFGPGSKKHN